MDFTLKEFGVNQTNHFEKVKRNNPKGKYKKRVFSIMKEPKDRNKYKADLSKVKEVLDLDYLKSKINLESDKIELFNEYIIRAVSEIRNPSKDVSAYFRKKDLGLEEHDQDLLKRVLDRLINIEYVNKRIIDEIVVTLKSVEKIL